jgi:hypothetical protein
LITASRLIRGVTDGVVVKVVAVESLFAAGLAFVADVTAADESLDFTAGLLAPLAESGNSTDAVCMVVSLFAGCCARAINGISPQHTIATAGTAFQGMFVIQPLTFTKDLGIKCLERIQQEAGISSAAPQACLSSQFRSRAAGGATGLVTSSQISFRLLTQGQNVEGSRQSLRHGANSMISLHTKLGAIKISYVYSRKL